MAYKITTYKDFDVHYDEDKGEFTAANSEHRHATLKGLKGLIDKASVEERRVSRPALRITGGSMDYGSKTPELVEVTVTTLVQPASWQREIKQAWIRTKSGDREKVDISSLLPPGNDTQRDFAAYRSAWMESQRAKTKATEALAAIKRLTADDLAKSPGT